MDINFIGRKNELAIFKGFLKDWEQTRTKRVLHFHGLPGIGKTYLRQELHQNLFLYLDGVTEKACIDFEDANLTETFKGLASLRMSFEKYKFPTFEVALMVYLEKSSGIKQQKKEGYDFLEELNFFG